MMIQWIFKKYFTQSKSCFVLFCFYKPRNELKKDHFRKNDEHVLCTATVVQIIC